MNKNVMSTISKLQAVRQCLADEGLDGYIVPKADAYQGEFVPAAYERLQWLSGFTGSAGTAVILHNVACVITDSRYDEQVKSEVDTAIFETPQSSKVGVWLNEHAFAGARIGYDPWLHTYDQIQAIKHEAQHVIIEPLAHNIIDKLWQDRPLAPIGQSYVFNEKIAGQSLSEKKDIIANAVRDAGSDAVVIASPDSMSWLLNVRGQDIENTPYVLSYGVVYADRSKPIDWIINPAKVGDDVQTHIGSNVHIVDEAEIVELCNKIDERVLIDYAHAPVVFKHIFENRGLETPNAKDFCIAPKAIKSTSEIEALKAAHIIDGVAVSRFLYWIDKHADIGTITEMDVVAKLLDFRKDHPAFRADSFPTIAGFGSNGAVVHYRPNPRDNKVIQNDSLLLVDSGGQYYDADNNIAGTTDITRTIAVGKPSAEMRENFTKVLQGHIAVACANLSNGATGRDVDALARAPLAPLNYGHGTGHGVGCFLAVHEAATSISPRCGDVFTPGMLISNEPGYYKSGHYGIRIENLVLVRGDDNEAKSFETVSFVPIDLRLVDGSKLNDGEKNWLNSYHARVYEFLKMHLNEDGEQAWLKNATRAI